MVFGLLAYRMDKGTKKNTNEQEKTFFSTFSCFFDRQKNKVRREEKNKRDNLVMSKKSSIFAAHNLGE